MMSNIVEQIDLEIARLTQARRLLTGLAGTQSSEKATRKRRVLSEEARERIREGQRKRWANTKKKKV